ncbi:MAG: N-acetylglucosamine-6-phosphate deacetylase [Ignavibacteriae bacterium]|jgi:N-acetylglucosamine-6-phosphate deacetylase|nr:N-acetylglucosamine-6-phosphate deacetylase [Ignavibacteriota bacterium]NOG96547.1 N-acetylglucosamine-6-phosphate deacetylase [Ignavibacteriota bacterium]
MKLDLALIGGKVVTPFREVKNGGVTITENKIYEVGQVSNIDISDCKNVIDVSGKIVAPGFVDLLVHGGGGYGFSDDVEKHIDVISNYFIKHGSTTMLASLHAKPWQKLLDDLSSVAKYIKDNPDSNIKGIHMEGPYLNKALKGAMNEDYLLEPAVDTFTEMYEAADGFLKMMTIAPELPNAMDVIREASFRGVVCSLGHSKATYEQIDLAIDNGATHVTHIFNAMDPLHHRHPSLLAAALLRDELKIELIADNFHVHPATMELLMKIKSHKGIVLITDSIRAGGMHDNSETQFSDQKVYYKDQKATLADGTLAGSTLTLNRAIKNIVENTGTKLTDAIRMASLNGSKVIGASRGILASGKVADIVVMNKDYEVELTVIGGKIRYNKSND